MIAKHVEHVGRAPCRRGIGAQGEDIRCLHHLIHHPLVCNELGSLLGGLNPRGVAGYPEPLKTGRQARDLLMAFRNNAVKIDRPRPAVPLVRRHQFQLGRREVFIHVGDDPLKRRYRRRGAMPRGENPDASFAIFKTRLEKRDDKVLKLTPGLVVATDVAAPWDRRGRCAAKTGHGVLSRVRDHDMYATRTEQALFPTATSLTIAFPQTQAASHITRADQPITGPSRTGASDTDRRAKVVYVGVDGNYR